MDIAMETCHKHYVKLRQEMEGWLAQSRRMDPPSVHGGGEDEANYALAWFPHYLVTGSPDAEFHFQHLVEMLADWSERECVHGYRPMAEAHHGPEPFLLFLPRYLGLFPDDENAVAVLEDAAHHIGNWVPDTPAWFDWERNRFYGYRLGTRTVENDRETSVELAEHFRFIHIALAAHRTLGEERYLEWALRYGRRRAEMIVQAPDGPLPLLWGPEGEPMWPQDVTPSQRAMTAANHQVEGDPLGGVEVLLASGAIYALGDLFAHSGEDVYQQAARRIAEPLVNELHDPYGDPAAAAVAYYRQAFEDDSLDERIRGMVERMPAREGGELVMLLPEIRRRTLPGVGKRADMVWWGILTNRTRGETTMAREPCSGALTLAYGMTGDTTYAERALRQATRRLAMARRVLRGGREHADMGGAVCSVAAGHGRNWGWGTVTGCYGPLVLGTREVQGAVRGAVEARQAGGEPGLPEEVLSLVIPPGPGEGEVRFFNGGDGEAAFSWRAEGMGWEDLRLRPGETVAAALEGLRR
jgi:hypothetical protein